MFGFFRFFFWSSGASPTTTPVQVIPKFLSVPSTGFLATGGE